MSYTQFLYLKLEPHQNWCRYWFHCHIKRTSSPYQRSIYPIPISMGMEVNQNEMKLTKSNGIGAMWRKHVLTHSNVSNNHIKHNNMFNVFFPLCNFFFVMYTCMLQAHTFSFRFTCTQYIHIWLSSFRFLRSFKICVFYVAAFYKKIPD